MTQNLRDYKKIEYKLDQDTAINAYEINAYNVPFAGNTSLCRETFVSGDRLLEFSVAGDLSFKQVMSKPIFRDELVEYMFSISRQLVSMTQNGMKLEKVVLNTDHMFVRLADFSIQLLYLPLECNFEKTNVGGFVNSILSKLVYAHTPAIECANQIVDYFDQHNEFDVFHFNNYVSELRATSRLLIIQGENGKISFAEKTAENNKEQAIKLAQDAVKKAKQAKIAAEDEARRKSEEARKLAEKAKQAEETRIKAEAARIEAEIMRQKAEAEARDYEETAILSERDAVNLTEQDRNMQLQAEVMYRNAMKEQQRAQQISSRYADEIRQAREQEMEAEEARIQAEFAAKKSIEEARRQAELALKREEEAKRLSEETTDEPPTTLFSSQIADGRKKPILIRKSTGESVVISKQVFCIGKAEQGVDFKITGNRSVSRRHAYITSINGVNYLRDNNSTNHTYLNGTQVYSNIDVVIPDNSIIRLSNEEFLFKANS